MRGTVLNGEATMARTRRRGADGESVAAGVNLNLGGDRFLGITRSLRRTLVYTQAVSQQTGASGQYAEGTFTLNNPFQLGSGSAVGFAKYMAFYSKCFALSSRWVVRGRIIGASTDTAFLGAVVTTNGTPFTSYQDLIHPGLCKWTVKGQHPDSFELSGRVNHARFLNKPNYLDDPQLFVTASAGPGQVIVLHVGAANMSAAVQMTISYVVEIVIDCVFTDPLPFS